MADFTRITPNIWLGSRPTRAGAQEIARAGATYALDVRGEPTANGYLEQAEPEKWEGTGVRYAYVPMRDNGSPIPEAKYAEATNLILDAVNRGGIVFVYCSAGQYRSPSVVYAALRRLGMSKDAAWAAVRQRRVYSQYVTCADRYLHSIGIGDYSGGCGSRGTHAPTPGPTQTAPPPTTTKPVGADGGSSSFLQWLGIAAVATGVYFLAKNGGVRRNPSGLPVDVTMRHLGYSEAITQTGAHTYRAKFRYGALASVYTVIREDRDGDSYRSRQQWSWELRRPGQRIGVMDMFGKQLDLPDYLVAQDLLEHVRTT